MTQVQITLSGNNLGKRHHDFNKQVETNLVPLEDIEDHAERPLDILFKIEVANKVKNVEYILKILKNDDLLYVSKALKCKWLLKHREIINPEYLENVLFPDMVITAVTKMKHWLYINLREAKICEEFYIFYKEKNFDYAIKFLNKTDKGFLEDEFPKILTKITPHYLKVFGENNSKLIKIYFDSLESNKELVKTYLKEEKKYYNTLKYILKSDPELFFDITERYNSLSKENLSAKATEFILRHHKDRFMKKAEFYLVYLLHIPTVALELNTEECQNLIILLARSDYLNWWLSYPKVEPLIKRIDQHERAAFKKRVFVDKDVGDRVTKWPYDLPGSPTIEEGMQQNIFEDQDYEPIQLVPTSGLGRRMMKKRKCMAREMCEIQSVEMKSELQKLFDEFRFKGFDATIHELKDRLTATSSADRRRDILLVLVSKSGGREENLRVLLQLALKFRNEPVHQRATVVRSLVKRASIWRVPHDIWDDLMTYSYGLGLDGTRPEAECIEGLHAVVIRQFLDKGLCVDKIREAFLEKFSTFSEYKLVKGERVSIATGLRQILVEAASSETPDGAAKRLKQLLDVLQNYHISLDSAVPAITALAERDSEVARPLLIRLYNSKVGRRELLRENLKFCHNDAALLNALRHDPDAIKPEWLIDLLVNGETRANQSLLKIALYFNEFEGLGDQVRKVLEAKIVKEFDVKLARPLVILSRDDLTFLNKKQDRKDKFSAAIRANMHYSRPAPDSMALGWRKAGMKAVANRVLRCPQSQVESTTHLLLERDGKRAVRLVLALAQRADSVCEVFSKAYVLRPLATLRGSVLYFRKAGIKSDLRIWEIVKPLIWSVDLGPRQGLRRILSKVEYIPKEIKPDYSAVMYLALDKLSKRNSAYILREVMKRLPEIEENLLEKVLHHTLENMAKENPECYPAIIIRYLMLSKSENQEKLRFENIGGPFLEKLDVFRKEKDDLKRQFFSRNVEQLIQSMQYNLAFFDNKYEYCLPIIERILNWIQKCMPKEVYFEQYVKIHALMIYNKAIRQSIKQKPEVFQQPETKFSTGVEIIGNTFGKYISKELDELVSKYFNSITELYVKSFVNYLNEYFIFGQSRALFTVALIKGIISDEGITRVNVGSGRLAVYIWQEFRFGMKEDMAGEIKELLLKRDEKECKFFLHACM